MKRTLATPDDRRRFWDRILQGCVAERVFSGHMEEAEAILEKELAEFSPSGGMGEVYLVGGGPGDPDLLTFRALLHQPQGTEGEQVGIAGAATHQVDLAHAAGGGELGQFLLQYGLGLLHVAGEDPFRHAACRMRSQKRRRSSGGLVFRQAQHLPGEPPEREGELTQFTAPSKRSTSNPSMPTHPRPRAGSNEPTRPSRIAWSRNCVWPASRTSRPPTPSADLYAGLQPALRQVTAKPCRCPSAVLHSSEELDLILSLHATRKLSKNLTFQFKNREYQLTGQDKGYRLRGAQVTVCEAFDDTVTVLYKGQTLSHRVLSEGEPPFP